MIVAFSTRHGQLTLLGESAVALLRLGGHSGTVPGAILAADLPGFLRQLRAGLSTQGDAPSPPLPPGPPAGLRAREADDEPPAPVTLRMRAVPFLDLVQTAIARGSDLMWERA